jgi:type I restriction enzyme R subunit
MLEGGLLACPGAEHAWRASRLDREGLAAARAGAVRRPARDGDVVRAKIECCRRGNGAIRRSDGLRRIGEQVEKEIIVDRDALDRDPFAADGGFARLNKVFDGELERVLSDINEEMWKKAG